MKIVNRINSEDILTIDIETVREYEELKDAPASYQFAWECKNKQNGEVPDFVELSRLYENKAPLYAEFSKICAISVSYLTKEGLLKCKSYAGTDEIKLLNAFSRDLEIFYSVNKSYRLMGHAAKFFDYPFLCKRYIIQGLDIPSYIDESDKKPWEMRNLCTNDLWRSFGTGAGSSLQALCGALKVPVSKVDLVGDEVGKAYYNGEIKRIGMYCNYDVVATFNVFRKYKKEEIFKFEDVIYVENDESEERTVTLNVLDHILASGQLTSSVVSAIVAFTEENNLNKEDVLTLVKTALAKSKQYQSVKEEDFIGLKDALGLTIDYSLIQVVVDKGNLAKLQVNALIKQYEEDSAEVKKEVVRLTEQFLRENNKIEQVTAKKALEFLKEKLK